MQREELSDCRNRQAAETREAQNEDQIWQRLTPYTPVGGVPWTFTRGSSIPTEKVFGSLGKLGEWLRTNELNKAYVEKNVLYWKWYGCRIYPGRREIEGGDA
jgi:hypothetical protein